ncbi:MAG: hypothetical protein HRU26_09000 [Psychroserpens sp.]|nr:hypothetical protein [Psychroserpens sp.]
MNNEKLQDAINEVNKAKPDFEKIRQDRLVQAKNNVVVIRGNIDKVDIALDEFSEMNRKQRRLPVNRKWKKNADLVRNQYLIQLDMANQMLRNAQRAVDEASARKNK